MDKRINFILIMILIITVVPIIDAVSCTWSKYGANQRGNFVQQNCETILTEDYDIFNVDYTSDTLLVADLNDDNYNELILLNDTEIKIIGETGNLIDSYYNPALIQSGEFVIDDFIDSSSEKEIVMTINNNSDFKFIVINWNGNNFSITKNIDIQDNKTYGINCFNIDSDDDIECLFFMNDSCLYAYDSTNTLKTSPKFCYTGTGLIPTPYFSIPKTYDIDDDDDNDIATVFGSNGNSVLVLINDGDGNFNIDYIYNFTFGVNQIKMANLDGGQKELVITDSKFYYHASNTISDFSDLYIYNIESHSLKCSESFDYKGNKQSPYISQIKTCYDEDSQLACDYDGDGYDDVYIILNWYATDSDLQIYDENCIRLYNVTLEDSTSFVGVNTDNTYLFPQGVYAQFGGAYGMEYTNFGSIWTLEGNKAVQLGNYVNECITTEEFKRTENKIIIADVTNDGLNDYIIQDICNNTRLKIFSFNYTNHLPTFRTLFYDTGNPVCIDTNVAFSVEYGDIENNYVRIAGDCKGDNSTVNGTFYNNGDYNGETYVATAYINCYYNETGNYDARFYIQDLSHPTDYTVYQDYTVTVTDSEFCNEKGEGSGSTESEIGISGGADDWSSTIPNWLNDWGFKSTTSKIFFGICIIIALILGANKEFKNAFISIIIGILSIIGLTYLGIFPIWITFLIFLFTAMLVFLVVFKLSSGDT